MVNLAVLWYSDVWSNTILDVVVKVCFRCDSHLNQQTVCQADSPPLHYVKGKCSPQVCGWAKYLVPSDWKDGPTLKVQ